MLNDSWWDINHKKVLRWAYDWFQKYRASKRSLITKKILTTNWIFSKVDTMGSSSCWLWIWCQILKIQDGGYNMADTNTGTVIRFYGHCYIVVFSARWLRIFCHILEINQWQFLSEKSILLITFSLKKLNLNWYVTSHKLYR